jgi:hypothetical protein
VRGTKLLILRWSRDFENPCSDAIRLDASGSSRSFPSLRKSIALQGHGLKTPLLHWTLVGLPEETYLALRRDATRFLILLARQDLRFGHIIGERQPAGGRVNRSRGAAIAPSKLPVVTCWNPYDRGCILVTCIESLVESKVPVIVTFWPA